VAVGEFKKNTSILEKFVFTSIGAIAPQIDVDVMEVAIIEKTEDIHGSLVGNSIQENFSELI
jgi:hypothetical protein